MKYFVFWVGEVFFFIVEEGLCYSFNVVVFYVVFNIGIIGVGSYYGDGSI